MQLILTIMCKLHSRHFLPIDGFYVIRKFPGVIACAILRLSFKKQHFPSCVFRGCAPAGV